MKNGWQTTGTETMANTEGEKRYIIAKIDELNNSTHRDYYIKFIE